MNNTGKITAIVIMLFTTVFYGQRRPDREKIKSLKVAFITERLNLSSEEAQAFWPIYNAHEEKMEGFRQRERMEIFDKLKDLETVSEADATELLDAYMALEEEKRAENKAFLEKLKQVISAKKTFLLMGTENGFKRRLLRQYREKRRGGL